MPWHTKPGPADAAVVRTPEELAEIEAARMERDKVTQKRGNAAFRARRKAQREAEGELEE
jgi:hypothetical protein